MGNARCEALANLLHFRSMDIARLDYALPESLIAQHPCRDRDGSRLLVVDRKEGSYHEDVFRNLAAHLDGGDCLVMNDTKVIKARLLGHKPTGGRVELFLLKEMSPGTWSALVRPSARVKPGTRITVGEFEVLVGGVLEEGQREVVFNDSKAVEVLESAGHIPLPPYIRRAEPEARDAGDYQTIYARSPGAVAAPTAGLHFSDAVFEALEAGGINRRTLTLHVGYGTFKPITAERLEDHRVDAEEYHFPSETADFLNETRRGAGRIVAVGTTSTRVLETCWADGEFRGGSASTDCYLYPPYTFRAVDALLTNFHLPKSSLLALVCAFAGTDLALDAYRYAVEKGFRFYSYGDAMLIV